MVAPARRAPNVVALLDGTRAATTARLRQLLDADIADGDGSVYALVAYHLGWRDEAGASCSAAAGKMLRPALLLTVASGYGDEAAALDASCAVELLHAFSLVHDDIEDGDRERHHRPTVWALHGVPLAINAGDSLFALAQRTLVDAAATLPMPRAMAALRMFTDACLRMIEGQHADLAMEHDAGASRDDYVRMTAGKTGALLGASLALGAIFGGAAEADVERLRRAGLDLGIAFQAVDDSLAVWGDAGRTGKAVGNDAARGKQSLPAIIGAELGAAAAADAVREGVRSLAADHASRALGAVGETALAEEAIVRIEALAAFILEREA
ncbi:MAG: polyprenyl synthetase family protein [Dehalococcoidia bacterium]|nr:polyprenyl synthetase family protein [Dehalococcoidia bacterium]